MALSIVLGLAILSVANYGNTFEFSGLDPSVQSKTQLKPTIKPFPSFTNQPGQGDQVKSTFGFKNVATKPFGLPFDSFKPSYQHYQPGPFRANYQPFGPYPGYPGPVVYPGQGNYPGPAAYPVPPYHFNDPNQRQFGFQPFPAPAQQSFNPFKFGSAKKFNKNVPGLADINLPGKYFQEHQFGAYHGPEFTSTIVPAEHNIKQSKPKDTLIGKPAIPTLSELGFPKQNVYGFAPPPPSFRYPLPSFPSIQPFANTVSPANSVPTTASPVTTVNLKSDSVSVTTAVPAAQDESATVQASEVTGEPSVTPAADPQPISPSQEEVTAGVAVEVTTNNEVPAADDTAAKEQSEQSNPTEGTEPSAVDAGADGEKSASQENDSQVSAKVFSPVVVEEVKETSTAAADSAAADAAAPTASSGAEKSGEIKENLTENKPTEPTVATPPGLPNDLFAPIGDVPLSVPSYIGASGYPYFGQTADFQQPPFFANYEAPKFSEEELKQFEANFKDGILQSFQAFGGSDVPLKISEGVNSGAIVSTESSAPVVSSTPSSAESGDKVEINEKVQSGEQVEGGEKKATGESELRSLPEAPRKTNTVQIIQDDPFNGQLPLLYDPSNSGSPLDPYRFYSHPSVSALSSQATLATYSPEDAFTNFGTQFRQGYLVEGSPSLTPVTKTIVQTSQIPISISSKDHPLHSQVFKFSQSFVPYPEAVASNNAAAFRSFEIPSSTIVPVVASDAPTVAADVVSSTTQAAVESSSSTETA